MSIVGSCLKSWSRTQKSRALSSGEAEYYALIGGAAEALGLQAVAHELGWDLEIRLFSDAKAARGMAARRGLGKTRHIEVKFLWLQQAIRMKRLTVHKVCGKQNPANHLTKPLSRHDMQFEVHIIGGTIEVRGVNFDREEMENDYLEERGAEWEMEDLCEALGVFSEVA